MSPARRVPLGLTARFGDTRAGSADRAFPPPRAHPRILTPHVAAFPAALPVLLDYRPCQPLKVGIAQVTQLEFEGFGAVEGAVAVGASRRGHRSPPGLAVAATVAAGRISRSG